MVRRRAAATILASFLLAASASSQYAPTLAHRILGRWRLVSIENRDDPSKPWESRYGASPAGYLDYASDGHMSVQISKMPRPRFASGQDRTPTPEEGRDAYLGYVAYFGTYRVDEQARVVTHHVEASLMPSFAGTDQERPATLEGNRLILSDGKTFRVVWERAKP
jgi:lipocalin-like protein